MESTITVLRARLDAVKTRWPELAKVSGVPLSTLQKVGYGYNKDPRVSTVDKLSRGLAALPVELRA